MNLFKELALDTLINTWSMRPLKDTVSVRLYYVTYKFPLHDKYPLHILEKNGSMSSADITLVFDEEYQLFGQPNFASLAKAYNKFKESDIVNLKEAINNSLQHFSKKARRNSSNTLVYYEALDLLVWRISKAYGFTNVTTEHVYISAHSLDYIHKEESKYQRNFWMAIGNIFGCY